MVEYLMDLGPWEIAVIFVGLAVPAMLIFLAVNLITRVTHQSPPQYAIPEQRRPLPPEVVGRLQSLIANRQKILAIKEIRGHTGLGLKEAKDLADALEAGHYHPAATPLSDRVRAFKATGDHASALALVRAETGMTPAEADRFIQALD
jgi:Ribosomal protein L7/L12 C-terminal domain